MYVAPAIEIQRRHVPLPLLHGIAGGVPALTHGDVLPLMEGDPGRSDSGTEIRIIIRAEQHLCYLHLHGPILRANGLQRRELQHVVITVRAEIREVGLIEDIIGPMLRLHDVVRPGKIQVLRVDKLAVVGGGHPVRAEAGIWRHSALGAYGQLLHIAYGGVGLLHYPQALVVLNGQHGPSDHQRGTCRHQQEEKYRLARLP